MLEHHTATQAEQPLDLPDQFLLQISKLNSLDSRLACLQFKMGFSDRVDEVEVETALAVAQKYSPSLSGEDDQHALLLQLPDVRIKS